MSYLDIPRIHFSGRFFTDPSTVNNDPSHYNADVTTPSPWQTPLGQHRFEFSNCEIKSVMGPDGFDYSDPLLGTAITTVESVDHNNKEPLKKKGPKKPGANSPAKIVDIDVYQQAISCIYGLNITLSVGGVSVTGLADPPTLNQCWTNCVLPTRSWNPADYVQDSFGGDMNACGWFQTVLRVPENAWPKTASPILELLKASTLKESTKDGFDYLISIKFVLDGYQNTAQDKEPLTGRITGTLGPVLPNEPLYNPGQRWLSPRPFSINDPWNFPSFNDAIFKVDSKRNKLVIDLANSICRQSAAGPPVDLGTLNVYISTAEPVIILLGSINYYAFSYENNAQIAELDINDAQIAMLEKGKLRLSTTRTDLGLQTVLAEPETDIHFAVEVRPILMEGAPGTTATTTVYISKKGMPLPNKQLNITVESTHGGMPGVTAGPNDPGNTAQADGAIQASISPSNANGYATVTITVLKNPGARTVELDGQLYFLILSDPDKPQPDWTKLIPPQDQMISCKVFSQYTLNQNPEWEEIQKMMFPFMKLYPFMKNMMDLTDAHTFKIFADNPPWVAFGENEKYEGPLKLKAGAIPYFMSRDFNDARYMPISRDLSKNKIMTLLHYCKNLQSSPGNSSNSK